MSVAAGQNVLAAALAAGIPLPFSCRAGRCATCKATLIAGSIAYPGDALPPGIASSEAMKGEVLLCQAQPRSHLVVQTRIVGSVPARPIAAVVVESTSVLTTGATRVALRQIGDAKVVARPGHFVDVETAAGVRERAGVVAVDGDALDVEVTEVPANEIVRVMGPFDALR
ncbi:MAG: 2Fe-2S iron-sulfur cluster binding domain-containing protein [Steroidobacteraceae bacterium]|nr:2Fe-2S iron-sulfur cluster binding domain-containing protein [Steroidobacteraceae bacterium]